MNWPVCWTTAGSITCLLLIGICLLAKAPLDGLGLLVIFAVSLVIGLLVGANFRPDPYRLNKH